MSEQLIDLRNRFLDSVVGEPLFPYPGAPKGWEDKPSCSYMGPGACMRKAYYNINQRLGRTLPGIPIEDTGEGTLPAQMGWILEQSVRHWLGCAGIKVVEFDQAVDYQGLYYGHPDGWSDDEGNTFKLGINDTFIIEVKHQRVMSYMGFLRRGVAEESPLYYAQLQGYMAATGMKNALFIARPFDLSAVKGNITQGKRNKSYEGHLEPDFCMVYNSSGVNPAIYLELVPANVPYQVGIKEWAITLADFVTAEEPPDRGFDTSTDWQCSYCSLLNICLAHGRCKAQCGHKGCWG